MNKLQIKKQDKKEYDVIIKQKIINILRKILSILKILNNNNIKHNNIKKLQ